MYNLMYLYLNRLKCTLYTKWHVNTFDSHYETFYKILCKQAVWSYDPIIRWLEGFLSFVLTTPIYKSHRE